MIYAATTSGAHVTDPVGRVMSWPVATVQDDTALDEVIEELAAEEVGVVLVLTKGHLAGIVSERDVIGHVAAGADLSHLTAGDVMSDDLITVESAATILESAQAMDEGSVRHLPVLEGTRIAGVVSIRDLFEVLVRDAG
jgi:CBS domain-containing protein